jgi:glycosyltransferase involved in cell wall biosynthesis
MSANSDEPRIVVTHIISGDLWAGAEVQAFQLCQALKASKNIEVTAIIFNDGILHEKLKALGIAVSLIDERRTSPARMVAKMKQHLHATHTDIVHTHGHKENVLGVAAGIWAGTPCSVRTTHGNPEIDLPWTQFVKRATQVLDTLVAKFGQDRIVAVSGALEKTETERFGSKVCRISNFINVDGLRSLHLPRTATAVPSSELHIGIVGRLVPVKRVDLFIRVIEQLRSVHGVNAVGHIYGDGPLRGELEQQAKATELGQALIFHGFTGQIYPELAKLNILLMTSDHEGLPMVLLEAQALEIPIVAHHTGGIPEVLDNGRAGILVNSHTTEGYTKGALELLNHEKREKIATAALIHLRSCFDVRINSEQYLALYKSLRGKNAQSKQH